MRRSMLRFSVMLLALVALHGTARAERVLVLEPLGNADEDLRDDVQDALFTALRTLAFEGVTEGTEATDAHATPEDANDFRALADLQRVQWVVLPRVRPRAGGYELTVRVGYAAGSRIEDLTFEVARAREQDRLVEVLRAMLRPEGLGTEDRMRLSGPDTAGNAAQTAADAEAARLAAEREAAAQTEAERLAREAAEREAFEARERERAEAEAANAWESRERYGQPLKLAISGGLGVRGILNPPNNATGGALASLDFRFGWAVLESVPGFELRFGAQAIFGATGGISLFGGAAYLFSPFETAKVHLGATAELGMFYATTGNRAASFLVRLGGMASWHVTDKVWLETILPSFEIFSANGGIVTLGLSVAVGTRF
jgi:hypothetical protein